MRGICTVVFYSYIFFFERTVTFFNGESVNKDFVNRTQGKKELAQVKKKRSDRVAQRMCNKEFGIQVKWVQSADWLYKRFFPPYTLRLWDTIPTSPSWFWYIYIVIKFLLENEGSLFKAKVNAPTRLNHKIKLSKKKIPWFGYLFCDSWNIAATFPLNPGIKSPQFPVLHESSCGTPVLAPVSG